jgi:hypothetical protein
LFIFVHQLENAGFVMLLEETRLSLLNRLFEEATCLHGADSKKIVSYVKGRIEALGAADRAAIDGAVEQLLAFRAPDFRGGLLN